MTTMQPPARNYAASSNEMNALLSGSKGKIPSVTIVIISFCIKLVANELLYFNICSETCFIISCKR